MSRKRFSVEQIINHLQPPLAIFVFGHEGLRPDEPVGEFLPRQACDLPRRDEPLLSARSSAGATPNVLASLSRIRSVGLPTR